MLEELFNSFVIARQIQLGSTLTWSGAFSRIIHCFLPLGKLRRGSILHWNILRIVHTTVACKPFKQVLQILILEMQEHASFVGDTALKFGSSRVEGGFTEIDGERFYRISNYDAMPPFLMSIVSDSNHWLFISSNGALTAGRRDPDQALFPYYTDDRIHDSQDQTGSKTIILVTKGGKTFLWEPFSERYSGLYRVTRNLYKSVFGNKLIFEEINWDLSLRFSYAWLTSDRFGFIKRSILVNQGSEQVSINLLDGIQNILPYGVTRRFQLEYSTLVDGYKLNELDVETGLALFRLGSIPGDIPEPSEALKATVAWSEGLEPAKRLLSASQLDRFRREHFVDEEKIIRGRRGAYFINAQLMLSPNDWRKWYIVADVNQDIANVIELISLLKKKKNLSFEIEEDVKKGTRNLVRIVASADGLQVSEDELNTCRHYSNTLFNVMRGGIPDEGYWISRSDLISFIRRANRSVIQKHNSFLNALPEKIHHNHLLDIVQEQRDPDLERLVYEYLPLTFSRRHGDPSRPWNMFSIEVKDEYGNKVLNYQGNWRDIFQNWEALALSFPGYVESMIFKFVDASTPDGYNPYRVMRDGFEWETPAPHSPWSSFGYWGDHQVIYLLKLMEVSTRYHPGMLRKFLSRRVFTYANVPYRIKPYEELLKDPRNTIRFDADLDSEIQKRVAVLGMDGKFVLGKDGGIYHVNLTEKLLVLLLAKLSNYIPEAGIWMNTQRPEWNDANNALVGYGVSVVTLCYLRRFLAFCLSLFEESETRVFEVSVEVAEMFRQVSNILKQYLYLLKTKVSDEDRKTVLDALGEAGSRYRTNIYARGFSGRTETITAEEIRDFCTTALKHIDHSIKANRRDDGLFHSYNLIKIDGNRISIRRLPEMLEGQVAVLSSGILSPREAVELLDSLRRSSLYRADQNSYTLYPDRQLPSFLEKNNIPASMLERSRLLAEMVRRNDRRIIIRDVNGGFHFAAFRNARELREALMALREEYGELVEKEAAFILGLYEDLFDHHSFMGRSTTFFKYEGLGCIYWHMVSKLLLAVQEVLIQAIRGNEDEAINRLKEHYYNIREGIGVHKSPELYGAFPIDPYSHTPSFAGAQQPGMTGQVKEDIITRLGEMGVLVENGKLSFQPRLVNPSEFLTSRKVFQYFDTEGREQSIILEKDTLAFTICQVPVVAHRSGPARIQVTRKDGSSRFIDGLNLDPETSEAIFNRTGEVLRLDVFLGFN
ncbi:MAG: hypothetical protein QXZ11_03450 [Thermoproteota archaeon]